jgi:iron complex outermembrane receptor protein
VSIPCIFDQDSESWAFFGQATWNISNRLRFGLGLRCNEETKKLDKVMVREGLRVRALGATFVTNPLNGQLIDDLRQHSFTGLEREEDKWTYSATAQWDATENAMLYAVVSTGFKGGGYDEFYSSEGEYIRLADAFTCEPIAEVVAGADTSVLNYNEVSVLSYEIGAKMPLLDGAAEINVAAFRMEYEDLQTSSLIGDVFQVGNAGKASTQGFEFDGRWLLTERLTIGGAIAYLDATYDEFTGATCTVPQATDPENNPGCLDDSGINIPDRNQVGGQDLEGDSLLFAPDWSANFNVQYIVPLSDQIVLINSGDINYTDDFYSALDLDPNTKHDGATKVNAHSAIAIVDETYVVALAGKNLTEEDTQRWRSDLLLSNSNSYFAIADRPRSAAIQARYRFLHRVIPLLNAMC